MTGSLGQALQALRDASGLQMASVVGADGLVVEAAAESGVDAESLSAMAVSGLLMMDALGQELGRVGAAGDPGVRRERCDPYAAG